MSSSSSKSRLHCNGVTATPSEINCNNYVRSPHYIAVYMLSTQHNLSQPCTVQLYAGMGVLYVREILVDLT